MGKWNNLHMPCDYHAMTTDLKTADGRRVQSKYFARLVTNSSSHRKKKLFWAQNVNENKNGKKVMWWCEVLFVWCHIYVFMNLSWEMRIIINRYETWWCSGSHLSVSLRVSPPPFLFTLMSPTGKHYHINYKLFRSTRRTYVSYTHGQNRAEHTRTSHHYYDVL